MPIGDPYIGAVEEIIGRKVIAFRSQVHIDTDMAAEMFVLEPSAAVACRPARRRADTV